MKFPPKKILTGFRTTLKLKQVAKKCAVMESRSLNSYLENLICKDAEIKGVQYERGK